MIAPPTPIDPATGLWRCAAYDCPGHRPERGARPRPLYGGKRFGVDGLFDRRCYYRLYRRQRVGSDANLPQPPPARSRRPKQAAARDPLAPRATLPPPGPVAGRLDSLDRLTPAAACRAIRQLWDRPDGAVLLTSYDVLLQLHPLAGTVLAALVHTEGDDNGWTSEAANP